MTFSHRVRARLRGALVAGLVTAPALPTTGQGVLDRPPNLSGGWVGTGGTVHFNLVHRFTRSRPPARKVSNTPTILVAGVFPRDVLAGFNYGTNSDLVAGVPNEWEFFARVAPISQERGAPLDAALQVGYNLAAESVDGELSLARRAGPARFVASGRAFSSGYAQDRTRVAVGGGAVLRLGTSAAVAGDVVLPLDREDGERAAWSAGLQLVIPYTPHTVSLHVANTGTGTLQGSSRGGRRTMYGFEFTIPLTLRRYFPARRLGVPTTLPRERPLTHEQHGSHASVAPSDGVGGDIGDGDGAGEWQANTSTGAQPAATPGSVPVPSVKVSMRGLAYAPARLQVAPGTTVIWTNADPLPHTITASDSRWDSGNVAPGKTWSRTFEQPGRYEFFCGPHPFMKGVVVVAGARGTDER